VKNVFLDEVTKCSVSAVGAMRIYSQLGKPGKNACVFQLTCIFLVSLR
jgi:hypothetical protein